MPESLKFADATATEAAGQALARCVQDADPAPTCIFLHGALGAGKTTFARGFLRGFGHAGRVPSPTYTLVEPYEFGAHTVWHLDLYRLADGAELEFLGVEEMLGPGAVLLIEWPERAADYLPVPDLELRLAPDGSGRRLDAAAGSARGRGLLAGFAGEPA